VSCAKQVVQVPRTPQQNPRSVLTQFSVLSRVRRGPFFLSLLPRLAFRFENFAQVSPSVVLSKLPEANPWLLSSKLVAKPDQLIKRRGKVSNRSTDRWTRRAAR
jgi:hypothetical protein